MSNTVIQLEGVMSIAKVEGLHQQLEDAFRNSQATQIVATDVERIDTSVVQVLVSFKNAMTESGIKVDWELNELVSRSIELLGLEPLNA